MSGTKVAQPAAPAGSGGEVINLPLTTTGLTVGVGASKGGGGGGGGG